MMTLTRADFPRTQAPRLPGVYFLPPPPAAGNGLPPLDVAAFVGFTERGPLHLPTPVEDAATFAAIFGGDVALAETADGAAEYAYLPGSVAAFFANGGRRCYVVRVAGKGASSGVFPVPGLAALAGPSALAGSVGERAACATASSEGAWSDSLRLAPRLIVTPLPLPAFKALPDGTLQWDAAGAPSALESGDLLRLSFAGGATRLFPIAAIGIPSGATDESGERLLSADAVYPVLTASDFSGGPRGVLSLRRFMSDGATTIPLSSAALVRSHGNGVALEMPGEVGISPVALRSGDLLSLDLVGPTDTVLMTVSSLENAAATPLAVAVEAIGKGETPAAPPGNLLRVERLRLSLLLREGNARTFRLEEMAFGSAHSQFWGYAILTSSSPLNGGKEKRNSPQGGVSSSSRQRFDDYRDQSPDYPASVAAARFHILCAASAMDTDSDPTVADAALLASRLAPLTEETATQTVFLPVGMAQSFTEAAFVGSMTSGASDLGKFLPDLFLDAYFAPNPPNIPDSPDALLTAARDRRYVQGQRLRGIYSLLTIEEVALISVPDAVHPFWPAPPSAPAPPPPVEPPPPSPDVSQFHVCAPPPEEKKPLTPALRISAARLPRLVPPAPEVTFDATVLVLQHALFSVCQARRDAVAILTLPRHYEKRQCIAWQETFRRRLKLPPRRTVSRDAQEIADLSYAAVFHPWIYLPVGTEAGTPLRNGAASLRATPPDGAICGLIAARERQRQVGTAPANVAVSGALDLTPTFTADDWADLFALQFNLIRREPGDFRLMSAHTLSDQAELLQLSVRRLMILLRKAAYERGMDYVFEPNSDALRESVRLSLESLLRGLYEGGAFRGDSETSSFRVDVGPSVNPPESVDRGYFIVRIQVAPSQPMEFITVTLKRIGGDLTVAEA